MADLNISPEQRAALQTLAAAAQATDRRYTGPGAPGSVSMLLARLADNVRVYGADAVAALPLEAAARSTMRCGAYLLHAQAGTRAVTAVELAQVARQAMQAIISDLSEAKQAEQALVWLGGMSVCLVDLGHPISTDVRHAALREMYGVHAAEAIAAERASFQE